MIERRQLARRKTFLGGRILFNNRRSTMDCIVKSVGECGARAVFDNTSVVPNDIEISVTRMERVFPARVVWRSEHAIGVTFLTPTNEDFVPLDVALRLRQLETDNARLCRRVDELTMGA
jgi:hypothetical protein